MDSFEKRLSVSDKHASWPEIHKSSLWNYLEIVALIDAKLHFIALYLNMSDHNKVEPNLIFCNLEIIIGQQMSTKYHTGCKPQEHTCVS